MKVVYGLGALITGAVVALLIRGSGSDHASGSSEPMNAEAGQPRQQSADLEPRVPGTIDAVVATPVQSVDDTRHRTVGEDRSHPSFADSDPTSIDEDAARERSRQHIARQVRDSYSLLFEDLGLNPQEKDELFAFLIEAQIASTWTSYQDGRTMDPDERENRITAIIGRPKVQQFLALERNLASYTELRRIQSMLERKGDPLTETQRDGLFDVLTATRNQDYAPRPSGHIERYSLEQLERTLARMNERERHVIQLAPSVLLPQQVAHLHERYQHCSYERADDLEWQRRQRADHPNEPRPVFYRPCGP